MFQSTPDPKHIKQTTVLPVPELFGLGRVDSVELGEQHTDDIQEEEKVHLQASQQHFQYSFKQYFVDLCQEFVVV